MQHGERCGRDSTDFSSFLGRQAGDEMVNKGRNIVFSTTKRRHHNGKHVKPVIQILAELACLHHFDHVAIGCGYEADVDFDRFSRTNGINFAFLDGAQEFHLHIKRQFGNFIEKQRSAISFLEFAKVFVGGAGEGTLFVTKENRLD